MTNEFIAPFSKIEIRQEGDAPPKIFGLSVPYGKISRDMGGWREVFEPGSLTKTLRENKNIKSYWAHNKGQVLGSQSNGTLEVRETPAGVEFECTPNMATTFGRDAVETIKRGDVDSCSFAFEAVNDRFSREKDAESGKPYVLRHIVEARLYQTDPVSDPVYTQTYVGLRDFQVAKQRELRDSLLKKLNEWKNKELTKENTEELRAIMITLLQDDEEEKEEEAVAPEPVPTPPEDTTPAPDSFDPSIMNAMDEISRAYDVLLALSDKEADVLSTMVYINAMATAPTE